MIQIAVRILGGLVGGRAGVRFGVRQLIEEDRKAHLVATRRALNRAAEAVRTEAGREIRKVYNLPARTVRGQISIKRARPGHLVAEVIAEGRRFPLYQFGARQLARTGNVTVQVLRAGGRKVVSGKRKYLGRPFIQRMKSGHMGVFQRAGTKSLPIHELLSISIPHAFTSRRVEAAIRRIARERFEKTYEHEMKRAGGILGPD